jgi:hypothetical protein
MAAQVDPALRQDLADRYFFQLEVQRMYLAARNAFDEADLYIGALVRLGKELPPDVYVEVIRVLRDACTTLNDIVQEALEVIARIKPRRAFTTHMTHDLGHAATSARLPAGVELAYDGIVLDVSVDVE